MSTSRNHSPPLRSPASPAKCFVYVCYTLGLFGPEDTSGNYVPNRAVVYELPSVLSKSSKSAHLKLPFPVFYSDRPSNVGYGLGANAQMAPREIEMLGT